ncbi:hypothetical protein Nepgr_018878 [Nepenthes gracilis]|uniref:Integrase catalytic domain-containing protein n=1 Tax=Nepenthes gracilis TaxID=150966 RepID=A0AAD3XTJ2_NEPGR|nr:hypothetical protein Nepgr_018878 [Nepenthes gracilis]
MRKKIMDFVGKYLVCQQLKAERKKPFGSLQPLLIPNWKWEDISIDFVLGLPMIPRNHDAIWVIIGQLTKSTYFLAIRMTYPRDRFARMYIEEIVRLHGVLMAIISNQDLRFISKFWKRLYHELGMNLKFSTAYHPQTDEYLSESFRF